VAEEQHELTADEERDVEAVLSSYGGMNNDTSFLTARLQEELDLLETANVHAILESEADVGETFCRWRTLPRPPPFSVNQAQELAIPTQTKFAPASF
jgi:hypothetical protein